MNKLTRSVEKWRERNPLFHRDLGGFFDGDDVFVPLRHLTSALDSSFSPNINVLEREGTLIVEAELPGMTKKDVNVFVEDELLVIEGERRDEDETQKDGVVRRESRFGSFRRAIPIGPGIDPAQVKARFKNGMVRIELPNFAGAEPTRAEVPIS